LRRFELVLVFAAVFAVAWPVVFGVRPRRGLVAGALTLAIIAQLQFEGFRWQLIPLFGVTVGLALGDILFIDRQLRWSNRVSRGLFGLSGIVLAAALPVIFPVPSLPLPTGGLAIGTFTVEVVDSDREEVYGPTPGGARRFMTQVWYPAGSRDGDDPIPWAADWELVAPAVARLLGFPSWFLDHTGYTSSHATEMAPMAAGTFPVIIYSHDWTGFRNQAVNQMETLASNGYVVIALDHTFGAVATRLGDQAVEYDPAALPDPDEVGAEAYLRAGDLLITTFAADIVSVLDELTAGVDGPFAPLAASADLERVGVFGHAAGGGAAIVVCLHDERCDAVLGLDPWMEPIPNRVIRETPTRPALFVRSDEWRDSSDDAALRGLVGRAVAVTYLVDIEGTTTNDFTLLPLISPMASQLGLTGPIPAGRVIPILDNYLVGFFDVALLGTGAAALENVTFPEVSVEVVEP
jgi:dienelactone hydrolase